MAIPTNEPPMSSHLYYKATFLVSQGWLRIADSTVSSYLYSLLFILMCKLLPKSQIMKMPCFRKSIIYRMKAEKVLNVLYGNFNLYFSCTYHKMWTILCENFSPIYISEFERIQTNGLMPRVLRIPVFAIGKIFSN